MRKEDGKMFYAKLAFTNIRKNGKFYYPYLLTCIFTIAMYYIMCFVAFHPGLDEMRGADMLKQVMGFGRWVVAIVSFIFLIYANSFLMKRRKREFGMYNILGLEKRHIGKIMFFESVYVVIGTLTAGIVSGIIFGRLILMIISRLIKFDNKIGFSISNEGIITSIVLFAVIFSIILIGNLNSVRKTNPIELLHTSAAGEREPKAKILLTLVGIITLLAGYGIAIKVESAVTAVSMFFVAVILVVIGTYCIFVSGSISFLKMLKRNKNYYYKINHFTSVSGMIYRMKKNAAGLASICILSTMVLVVISTTVSLYIGGEDSLRRSYPYDISVIKEYKQETLDTREEENERISNRFLTDISNSGMKTNEIQAYEDYYAYTQKSGDRFEVLGTNLNSISKLSDCFIFEMLHAKDFEKLTGKRYELAENEVLVYSKYFKKGDKIKLDDMEFDVVESLKDYPVKDELSEEIAKVCYMVLPDENVMESIYMEVLRKHEDKAAGSINYNFNVNLDGSDEEKLEFYIDNIQDNEEYSTNFQTKCRQKGRDNFYMMNGSLLCLGIFLGLLFIIITVLIIYYKQITEGYEDRQRFEIMQKVGMSEAEVRKSIKSQILTVFIFPIIVAVCHIAGAFNMIKKILVLLQLFNVQLLVICTVCTILVFVVIYMIVYLLTSKVYYAIIKS